MKYPIENFSLNYLDSFKSIPMACAACLETIFRTMVLNLSLLRIFCMMNMLLVRFFFFFCEYEHTCVHEGNVSFEENRVLDETLFELDYELALRED